MSTWGLCEHVAQRIRDEVAANDAAIAAAKEGECVRVNVTDWGSGRVNAFCASHTYFGNGIEPNPWPCDPETRDRA